MKKILLLLSLLLAPSAVLADLGAAETPIPTDQKTLEAGAFCTKLRNDCKVKITTKMLIVDEKILSAMKILSMRGTIKST